MTWQGGEDCVVCFYCYYWVSDVVCCVVGSCQGEVVHWLACSLYAACRKGSTPTVGKGLMEGNCVSLTRILLTSKLRSATGDCRDACTAALCKPVTRCSSRLLSGFSPHLLVLVVFGNAPLTLVTVPPQPDPVLLQDEEVGRYVKSLPELQTSTEAAGAQLWGLHGHFPQVWAHFRGHVSESSGGGTPTKVTYQETQARAHKTLRTYTHSSSKMKSLVPIYIGRESIAYFTCFVPCGFPRLLIM